MINMYCIIIILLYYYYIIIIYKDHKSDVLLGTDRTKVLFLIIIIVFTLMVYISSKTKTSLDVSKVNIINTQNYTFLLYWTQTNKIYAYSLLI